MIIRHECYVALVQQSGWSKTVWRGPHIDPVQFAAHLLALVTEGKITRPGQYAICQPGPDMSLCLYIVAHDEQTGAWSAARGVGEVDIRSLHRWPPKLGV